MLYYLQLREMQEASNARHQRELAQVREATAREMKHYYLQCLHLHRMWKEMTIL